MIPKLGVALWGIIVSQFIVFVLVQDFDWARNPVFAVLDALVYSLVAIYVIWQDSVRRKAMAKAKKDSRDSASDYRYSWVRSYLMGLFALSVFGYDKWLCTIGTAIVLCLFTGIHFLVSFLFGSVPLVVDIILVVLAFIWVLGWFLLIREYVRDEGGRIADVLDEESFPQATPEAALFSGFIAPIAILGLIG